VESRTDQSPVQSGRFYRACLITLPLAAAELLLHQSTAVHSPRDSPDAIPFSRKITTAGPDAPNPPAVRFLLRLRLNLVARTLCLPLHRCPSASEFNRQQLSVSQSHVRSHQFPACKHHPAIRHCLRSEISVACESSQFWCLCSLNRDDHHHSPSLCVCPSRPLPHVHILHYRRNVSTVFSRISKDFWKLTRPAAADSPATCSDACV